MGREGKNDEVCAKLETLSTSEMCLKVSSARNWDVYFGRSVLKTTHTLAHMM